MFHGNLEAIILTTVMEKEIILSLDSDDVKDKVAERNFVNYKKR